jgi:penicillin-binding protein 2
VSCDSFYYQLGYRMGIERMARWLRRFGFDSPTGIGFGQELTGLVGTPEWAREVRGTPWYAGEAISVAIGQGPLLVTNLQLARAYAIFANGGRLVTPHLVASADVPPPVDLGLDPQHLALVVEGLTRVVHGGEGTAHFLARLPMAGKTGTAQVARLQEGVRAQDLPEHLRHHALFVGWAPLDEPKLVVAAVVEHGIGGSTAAAPVVGAVIEAAIADWNGTGDEQGEGSPASDLSVPARARHGEAEGGAGSASDGEHDHPVNIWRGVGMTGPSGIATGATSRPDTGFRTRARKRKRAGPDPLSPDPFSPRSQPALSCRWLAITGRPRCSSTDRFLVGRSCRRSAPQPSAC